MNGRGVTRLQLDFGRDQVCLVPGGSVVERSWDLRDIEAPGAYSRPRLLMTADIAVDSANGTVTLVWPDKPEHVILTLAPGTCISCTYGV